MTRKNLALALVVLGAVFFIFSFSGRSSFLGMLFWLAVVGGGVLLFRSSSSTPAVNGAPDSSIPSGFNATYHHANIALDTAAGKIWLRDGARSRVFNKAEIIGIQPLYDNMQGLPTMISNGVVSQGTQVKKNIRIDVQTLDLDHPTYTVRFRIKSLFTNTDLLYAEALSWANRLNAFLRSS